MKDITDAINHMKSNVAVVICHNESPRLSCYVQFLCSKDGPYYTCGYTVGNCDVCHDKGFPVSEMIEEFNAEMEKYDQTH